MSHNATVAPAPEVSDRYDDADEMVPHLVVIVYDVPFLLDEAAQVRARLAADWRCSAAIVCNVEGNPLAIKDPDRERCGLVVVQWEAEDSMDATEGVLTALPRENEGLVAIEAREIDTLAGQQ